MNILYLHTNVISDNDVLDTLREMECNVTEYMVPCEGQEQKYATEMLRIMEAQRIEVVMSLRYYPIVSIVCNAMKIKYAAWICIPYDPMIYSCTLLNECNYIFLADYALYQEFAANEGARIYYLPLASNVDRIEKVLSARVEDIDYSTDICMVQDIYPREAMPYNPLSVNSPLRDATKGYLEGCIACQYQMSGLPSMAVHLPSYVMDDLMVHFKPQIAGDSVEGASHYYDYQYFNELITYADRDIHLNVWAKNKHVSRVDLYNECKEYESRLINCHGEVDYLKQLPLIISQCKINYVVTHRNWRSGIPQISWDIMASGGFLLSNFQEDFIRIFLDALPTMYVDERDMLSKGIYYLHHENERGELSQTLKNNIRENHTYRHRIQDILSKTQGGIR